MKLIPRGTAEEAKREGEANGNMRRLADTNPLCAAVSKCMRSMYEQCQASHAGLLFSFTARLRFSRDSHQAVR